MNNQTAEEISRICDRLYLNDILPHRAYYRIRELLEEEHDKNCKWLRLCNEMNDEIVKYKKQALANSQEEREGKR